MGCAYAKNKMESEYHIHIGKTAGEPAGPISPQRQQPDEPSCHQQQYINQIYSKLHIEGDTRTKRSQLVELFLPNP